MRTVTMQSPPNPIRSRVFLPAFSIRTRERRVTRTLTSPRPRVAPCAALSDRWAILKMSVEKNMMALIPENCWAIMIITAMVRGILRVEFMTSSRRVTCGISLTDSYSVRISSISSCTSLVPLNHTSAEKILRLDI